MCWMELLLIIGEPKPVCATNVSSNVVDVMFRVTYALAVEGRQQFKFIQKQREFIVFRENRPELRCDAGQQLNIFIHQSFS